MLETVLMALGAGSLVAWLYLALLHGGFWRGDQRLGAPPSPAAGQRRRRGGGLGR